ncbi:MAG: hypothetical protein LBV43_10040 [Prevotella sp.]|jgi:uncharacterized membrane protein|nr:hypothetical protein [Prevotella sp.]
MNKFVCLILLTIYYSHSFAQIDENQMKNAYKEIFLLYPDSLTNHFPNLINENIAYLDMEYPGATRLNRVYAIFYGTDI